MSSTVIQTEDFVQSVADGLQYISYYHSPDFIRALSSAYEQERAESAKYAMAQILVNSRMCAEGRRPICQDTGIVVAFVDVGMDVTWSDTSRDIDALVNEGVRRAYQDTVNPLRASILADPAGSRRNTGDNTPAVVHTRLVPGRAVKVGLAAKGGGSENKARLGMLKPSDNIADWVVESVRELGAGWCPPGILGVGIGGTAEKAVALAKEALLEPIDIAELLEKGPETATEKLRVELYTRINSLGIGAQGLGGLTTVLDVKVSDFPTHAASQPVALIPNCAATRHIEFELDGSGPAEFDPLPADLWPDVTIEATEDTRSVSLDTLTRDDLASWKTGDRLLLSGSIYTARDAVHQKLCEMLASGEALPDGVDLRNRFVYYVGPVEAAGDEVVGPAGPTTATRMDKFTRDMLEGTGMYGMIGKAERSSETAATIAEHGAVYLIAVGGAAYLVSKAIRKARTVAFAELGMEALREFVVEDMPVIVAVDVTGRSIHDEGPAQWQEQAIRFHQREA